MDFNPAADRVRVINDADLNMRINPVNGARADAPTPDTTLNPAGAKVSGVAYDRVEIPIPPAVSGNTTAYAIGANPSDLYTLGGIDSSPSPNSGQLLNPKPLGVTIGANTPVGFDISPSGIACASLIVNGEAGLYTINLATGAATLSVGHPNRSVASPSSRRRRRRRPRRSRRPPRSFRTRRRRRSASTGSRGHFRCRLSSRG